MIPVNIVLYEPEIPANTGNIGRSCVAAGAVLHLIHPLGFSTEDHYIKRAGMDYWYQLDVRHYDSFDDFFLKNNKPVVYITSSKVNKSYADVDYPLGAYIMFGKESAGIPKNILDRFPDTCIRIPMIKNVRCLNLGSSAAIVLYEVLRQHGFPELS